MLQRGKGVGGRLPIGDGAGDREEKKGFRAEAIFLSFPQSLNEQRVALPAPGAGGESCDAYS